MFVVRALPTDRGGYREPPELAETRQGAAQKETTGRQEERLKGARAQAAGGSLAPRPQKAFAVHPQPLLPCCIWQVSCA